MVELPVSEIVGWFWVEVGSGFGEVFFDDDGDDGDDDDDDDDDDVVVVVVVVVNVNQL